MTNQEALGLAKVFYFLLSSGDLIHVLKYEKQKFITYQNHSLLTKRYDIVDGKNSMISMLHDLKKNYSHMKLSINIKKTEERYSITKSDYFKEAVKLAAREDE